MQSIETKTLNATATKAERIKATHEANTWRDFRNPMKLTLTRDEREMVQITILCTFAFTLIASAVVALALGLS
tara:strand:+ start:642 stop:860 length:219 start_codon:yes stop_codon:yes gene_type:complete